MSQIESRFVQRDISVGSLGKFKASLKNPAFAPRKYLPGHAREVLLGFLGDADRRGSEVFCGSFSMRRCRATEVKYLNSDKSPMRSPRIDC